MTPEEIQEKIKYDFPWYCENFLKIRAYDSPKLIPFRFNYAQHLIWNTILEDQAAGKPMRYLILKARKEGVTTFFSALNYHLCATNPHTDAIVAAHDNDTAIMIFDKVRVFYDMSPGLVQPMRKVRSRKELRFENPTTDEDEKRERPGLLSTFAVGTAGSRELARGFTLMGFHGSEVAFWGKEANKIMLGVINAIPDHDPNTLVALESTANGPSGYFYDQVMKAHKTPDKSAYKLIFLPWTFFDHYSIPLDEGEEFEIQDKLEEELYTGGVTYEQLKWRRWAIKNKCDGDLNLFRQEYPYTVEEAFIFTGRSVFDQEKLLVFVQNAREPELVSVDSPDPESPAGAMLVPDSSSKGKLYEWPKEGVSYCMGVDVSEGIDISEDSSQPDPDFSWINISRREDMRQVFSWRLKIDPDLLGPLVAQLGTIFNLAWICVEGNNHGILVTNYLKKNYPLYRLYTTVRVDHINDKHSEFVGFRTTSSTKAYAVGEGRKIIRDEDCFIYDIEMVHELQAYRQDNRGRYSGDGSHDDGVIAFLLTNIARLYSFESKVRNDTGLVHIPTTEELRKFDPALRIGRRGKKKSFKLGTDR